MKETAARYNDKSCRIQWHRKVYEYFTHSWAQFEPFPCVLIRGPVQPELFNVLLFNTRSTQILLYIDYVLPANPRCTPRLCPISILRWKLGAVHFPFFPPFLSSLLSFPYSTWEGICVHSWKGCIGWLDLWRGCSEPGFELDDQEAWETTAPAAWLLGLSMWLSSHPLREGEIILINAWKICSISHVIFRGCWSVGKGSDNLGTHPVKAVKKHHFLRPFLGLLVSKCVH